MIKFVIKDISGMVMVFDEQGEQLPEYQGQYGELRRRVLEDAPQEAIFGCFPGDEDELKIIPREEW
ncbi:MAG: hypothetical protein J7K77_04320 [Dehalococcoidales bacterium]|nr:hypothetical protein [Dehalococcoidales bacterium]